MAIVYRLKCPHCEEAQDAYGSQLCKKCGKMIKMPTDGCIQLYRRGNFLGVAAGMGIYLNGKPYGHIGNKQSIRIPLKAGKYKLHIVQNMNRQCNDPIIKIEPGSRKLQCYKIHIRMGVWASTQVVERVHYSQMP